MYFNSAVGAKAEHVQMFHANMDSHVIKLCVKLPNLEFATAICSVRIRLI